MATMRTLLIEPTQADLPIADDVASALSASGHEVVRCTEPGADAFPCKGLTHEGCPLEGPPVHAVVALRERPTAPPTAGESGITCALRTGLPVVVVGAEEAEPGPLAEWTEVCADVDRLSGSIERAVETAAERRAEPLVREVRRVLAVEGIDAGEVRVDVSRDGDLAHLTVRTELSLDARVSGVVATRVHAVDAGGAWPTTKVAVAVIPL